jgi:hypothetical protein
MLRAEQYMTITTFKLALRKFDKMAEVYVWKPRTPRKVEKRRREHTTPNYTVIHHVYRDLLK